jgi:hypothetical protein
MWQYWCATIEEIRMTRDEVFAAWAPPDAPWSGWVKPAPFAHLPRDSPPLDEPPADVSWAPLPTDRIAIVVDLPGAASVPCGLALAAIGYRPVPLFNAIPSPMADVAAVVNVDLILAGLQHGAARLRDLPLPADAPPAFLLDADRQAAPGPVGTGMFDNRSVVFSTDFPSATRLAAHGISRALLIRNQLAGIGADLTYALQLWRQSGVDLTAKWLSEPGGPAPLTLPRPSIWAGIRQRLEVLFGFRRNAAGEFGEFIPQSAGG